MALLSKLFRLKEKKAGKITKEWDFLADDIITTNPSVNKDGTMIFFGTKNGKIYALDAKGKKKWAYKIKKELSKEEMFFLQEEKFRQITAQLVIDIPPVANGHFAKSKCTSKMDILGAR